MAQKEATVYIVDCGQTMGEHGQGRKQTNLDWALQYVWDKITTTVSTNRKTAMCGVIAYRTDETDNPLSDSEGYENISVLQEIDQILMPQLRSLRERLVVSKTDSGDAISALVVAIQMISEKCKKLQYNRRIILVTDGKGSMDPDSLESIVEKVKEDRIELIVLGVDFDDSEFGFKEEDKPGLKADNEGVLQQLCLDCEGVYGTLAQAIEEMAIPRVKSVKPTHSYKGYLTLGNNSQYNTALSLEVERYPKVKKAGAPTASKFVTRGDVMGSGTQASSSNAANGDIAESDLAAIKNTRTYQVKDESAPGGKKEVDSADLSKGYEYGRTAVHIAESDRIVTQYETTMSFDIVGFVERPKYERYLDMSETCLTIAQKGNNKATMALSSFIHALHEMDSYAVARLVPKDKRDVKMVLLAPNITADFECLYDVELPFNEDFRGYRFPPLDRVVTVSGKHLTVHRNLPNDELQSAVDAYVDAMDLSTFGQNDDGEAAEYAPIDDTYNPVIHRLQQVIHHKAIYPDAEPPEPAEILLRHSHPPKDLVNQAQPQLDKVIEAANVKKVPPKARGKRFGRGKDAPKPLSDLDVAALLASDPSRNTKRINPQNAIPEYKQLLEAAAEAKEWDEINEQLKKIIYGWIRDSVGNSGYGRAEEAVRVMREEMVELEHATGYNDILMELKTKLLDESLGGDRSDMWYLLRVKKLRPITHDESQDSKFTDEEAKAFMSAKQAQT